MAELPGEPLDSNALVIAAAQASVSGERLPILVDQAQSYLEARIEEYRRQYERVHDGETHSVFFVEEGHWKTVGEDLDLESREWKALRRAHAEHLEALGREVGRREEFEIALELREVVVVGTK